MASLLRGPLRATSRRQLFACSLTLRQSSSPSSRCQLSTTPRRDGESPAETKRNASGPPTEEQPVRMTGDSEAYISLSSDPYFNLTLEDYLFRTRPVDSPVCLLYRNDACVVLGRNQNPWKELNCGEMRRLGLRMVRRRSGGGTVYHDPGNTNYSFHVSRAAFIRATHSELMVRALNAPPIGLATAVPASVLSETQGDTLLGMPQGTYVNKRNDICVRVRPAREMSRAVSSSSDPAAGAERKVSGSAYKLINARAYHHGTMLLGARLCSLGSALRNERGEALVTKGVASVPAPVINLSDAFPHRADALSHENLCQAVVGEFFRTYPSRDGNGRVHHVGEEDDMAREGRFREGVEELKSWEWTYGQTPEFSHEVRGAGETLAGVGIDGVEAKMTAKNGLITGVEVGRVQGRDEGAMVIVRELLGGLEGKRYDELALAPRTALNETSGEEEQRRIGLRALGVESSEDGRTRVAAAMLDWFREAL